MYKRQIIPLRVNKETVRSLRIEDEQTVSGVIIVSDGIFVLCDEIDVYKRQAWQNRIALKYPAHVMEQLGCRQHDRRIPELVKAVEKESVSYTHLT